MNVIEINIGDRRYPKQLMRIQSPPKKLYCAGDISLLDSRCVCVVGSRKTSEYGRWAAGKTAERLAFHGITVVSGLAMGIDTCAHKGALDVHGKTIAVLGCGIDIPYPWANRELKERIIREGLVITEYPPGRQATKYTFPQRNRIISGLSECGVVAEAGLNSGALITAEMVDAQSDQVFVIPGNINSASSIGSNMLLRDGAVPLVVIDDILEYLGIERREEAGRMKYLGSDEKKVFEALQSGGEMTIDSISEAVREGAGKVTGIVTVLEMKGLVYTALGKVFIAK